MPFTILTGGSFTSTGVGVKNGPPPGYCWISPSVTANAGERINVYIYYHNNFYLPRVLLEYILILYIMFSEMLTLYSCFKIMTMLGVSVLECLAIWSTALYNNFMYILRIH